MSDWEKLEEAAYQRHHKRMLMLAAVGPAVAVSILTALAKLIFR